MLYALLTLCGILSFISIRSTFFPLKWAAGFAWIGAFVYWIQADLVPDGSPTDMVIMLTLFFLGIIFLFLGFLTRGRAIEVEEHSGGGATGIGSRITKYTTYEHSPSEQSGRESAEEYRVRVRHALGAGKKKGRR